MLLKSFTSLLACSALFPAFSQETEAQDSSATPPEEAPAPSAEQSSDVPSASPSTAPRRVFRDEVVTLDVPEKSLALMGLHKAVLPREAEIRCGVNFGLSLGQPCYLGLTRGLAIGTSLSDSLGTTFLGQHAFREGAWYHFDVWGAFQVMDNIDKRHNMNVAVGFRGMGFEDDSDFEVERKDIINLKVNYAFILYPKVTIGLDFHFSNGDAKIKNATGERVPLTDEDLGSMSSFHRYLHSYPTARVGFPIDLELVNWKAENIDLPNHLRLFARAEPFFATYNFTSKHVFITENAFGSKLSAILAYESLPVLHSRRFTFKGELGAELSFNSKPKVEIKDKTVVEKEVFDFSLDRRTWGKPFLAVSASYQF